MDQETASRLNDLKLKRRSLEHLQAFTKQLSTMAKSMEGAQQIMNPSNLKSAKEQQIISNMMSPFSSTSPQKLRKALKALDSEIETSLKRILKLADQDPETFQARMEEMSLHEFRETHEALIEHLKNFRRVAHTDIAVRLSMKKRDMKLDDAQKTLPIPENTLKEKISAIKDREVDCKHDVVVQAKELIADTEMIEQMCPDNEALLQELGQFRSELKQNLKRLKEGKDILMIPPLFEKQELESNTSNTAFITETSEGHDDATAKRTINNEFQKKQQSDTPTKHTDEKVADALKKHSSNLEKKNRTEKASTSKQQKQPTKNTEQSKREAPKASPADDKKSKKSKKNQMIPQHKVLPPPPEPSPAKPSPPKKEKPGFLQRLSLWLNSSWDVDWKDIDDKDK